MSGNGTYRVAPGLLPRRFEFALEGDPWQASWQLRWTAGKIEYQMIPPDAEDPDEERTVALFLPSERQWTTFWRTMEEIGVWSWPTEYRASHGSTNWRLEIRHGEREVRSAGLGAFPKSGSPQPTPEFHGLLDALRILVDGRAVG